MGYDYEKYFNGILRSVINRCNAGPKCHYNRHGIKCYLTQEDINYLRERDSADKLTRPSLDRIDAAGPYHVDNCQFIELDENIHKRRSKAGITRAMRQQAQQQREPE